ncbi:tripartite tricarboxylate transporter TctB family protein [Dethiosulfatarculus sandiegensis]|uniref:DUF1468 domain-containing protein n=1 Tax=Dethiosulfatarculus sandiegensis TaxID=1429043 RepID=A0A0D2J9I1_9BACT|nr:tripartite tricarboxylate transporter TctB family protein [Dethiosulfatarculus sandiegensis]KIX14799.1 hypothetical protein X474_06550 [Dethiosulfatarculus sandiegensis]
MTTRSEVFTATGLLAFCVFNYVYLIPTQVVAEGSSSTYPLLINTLLALFSLAYLLEGFLIFRKQAKTQPEEAKKQTGFWQDYWRPLAMFGLTGVWIFTLEYIGFLPSTFVFLLLGAKIFRATNRRNTLIVCVVLPSLLTGIFMALNAPLPEGPLEEMIQAIIH